MKLLATYDDDNSINGRDRDTLTRSDSYKVFRASDFFALSSYDTLEGSYLHHLFHSTSPESEKKNKKGGSRGSSASGSSSSVGNEMPILPVAQLLERNTSRTDWMLVRHCTDTPSRYTRLTSRSQHTWNFLHFILLLCILFPLFASSSSHPRAPPPLPSPRHSCSSPIGGWLR